MGALRSHRGAWGATAAIALALVALAGWHYLTLYRSLLGARSDLLAVESQLSAVGVDVQAEDLDGARELLGSADTRSQRAARHMDRDPLLQLARHMPGPGTQVEAAYVLVDMSSTIVSLGFEALDVGERIVELRDDEHDVPVTEIGVQLLEDLEPQLLRLDELTQRLVDQRIELGDGALLPPLDAARTRLDERLPELASAVRRGVEARDVLPAALGFDEPRRYLLIALNNAEILPGGGLVSVAGVIEVTNGRPGEVDFTGAGQWKPQWDSLGGAYIEPPGPLQRYLLQHFSWNLPTSNWSPDFPTWSRQALEFYELAWGPQDVDGVITVDLDVLEGLLRVTGPKQLVTQQFGTLTLDADNAVLELERISRRPYEEEPDRKAPVGDFAALMLHDVLDLPTDRWDELAETLSTLGNERHIQVFMFDEQEQALITELGWSGRLEPVAGDYVQMNEASLNSTKLNLIIFPEGTYHIDVGALGDARHELHLRYDNPFSEWAAGKDPDLVSRLMIDGQYGAYLRVLSPPGTVNASVEVTGTPAAIEDVGTEGPYDWFGTFVPVPPDETREVTLRWTVPLATSAPGASTYELFMQKQPGTRGMCLDLSIAREGVPARVIDIEGGSLDEDGRICLTTDVTVRVEF
ncbi:MAG: DUF4012 domain-containing protein [Dehalococcoidia bacterium]